MTRLTHLIGVTLGAGFVAYAVAAQGRRPGCFQLGWLHGADATRSSNSATGDTAELRAATPPNEEIMGKLNCLQGQGIRRWSFVPRRFAEILNNQGLPRRSTIPKDSHIANHYKMATGTPAA